MVGATGTQRMKSLWSQAMTCPYYMGPSCGLRCCMTRAEQFAFFEINEPSFAEFCPMVQRYGEFLNRGQDKKTKDQCIH